jgi:hypothetical protein
MSYNIAQRLLHNASLINPLTPVKLELIDVTSILMECQIQRIIILKRLLCTVSTVTQCSHILRLKF